MMKLYFNKFSRGSRDLWMLEELGVPFECVTLDMRTFYLKDLTLVGCTAWDEPVFPNLVGYIERGEIRPLVAKTFPLDQIAAAQREFLEKRHVGNFVLIPPSVDR